MLTTNNENNVSQNVGLDIMKTVVNISIDILNSISKEYDQKQALEKQAKKDACIALIEKAVKENKRISKQALFKIIPCLRYCNTRADIAQYVGVSIETFEAGVKRWYHVF